MIKTLRKIFYEPKVLGIDVDDNVLLEIHKKILIEKPLLRSAFKTFYHDMTSLCDLLLTPSGIEVELGSGAGFFKSLRPNLITSDIRKESDIDISLDAQNMSLPNDSVRCIYAINVFHHLPDPCSFFLELCRVLRPGGGCILIEPHGGFFSATLHRHLHSNECFIPEAKNWETSSIGGPLSGAYQALAYIVFERDIEKFNQLYGGKLEIIYRKYPLNAFRYLFSGGLNFRQLIPSVLEPFIRMLEFISYPFARSLSLHQIIVIRKIENVESPIS